MLVIHSTSRRMLRRLLAKPAAGESRKRVTGAMPVSPRVLQDMLAQVTYNEAICQYVLLAFPTALTLAQEAQTFKGPIRAVAAELVTAIMASIDTKTPFSGMSPGWRAACAGVALRLHRNLFLIIARGFQGVEVRLCALL